MEHLLDNPPWNALISGNKGLACGNGDLKYFDNEVSPFVALKENTQENLQRLYEVIPGDNPRLFVSPQALEIPAPWKVLQYIKGFQMVCGASTQMQDTELQIVPLTTKHVPQMLELTSLTNPGPFASRTIEFGHYHGIFDNEQLVAMAGQRLHAFEYAEVSAVCTHPGHLGKGYARQLLIHQINRIRAASNIPYLHVRYDNDRAIKVYESLGFATRTEVYFYVIKRGE